MARRSVDRYHEYGIDPDCLAAIMSALCTAIGLLRDFRVFHPPAVPISPQVNCCPMSLIATDESLDAVRSALCSLSWLGPNDSRPAHIHSIGALVARLGHVDSHASGLRTLSLIREAQHVGGGYWVPAPERIIKLAHNYLIVSPNPTTALTRFFGPIKTAGACRTMDGLPSASTNLYSLENWIDAPTDLPLWTKTVIADATHTLRDTMQPAEEILVYVPWLARMGRNYEGPWRNFQDVSNRIGNRLVVCKTPSNQRRFFGEIVGGRIVREAEINVDRLRLSYGINVLSSFRSRVFARSLDSIFEAELSMPLPEAEARLINALAVRTESEIPTYRFSEMYAGLIGSALSNLGIDLTYPNA
jgi:hypothetical protein